MFLSQHYSVSDCWSVYVPWTCKILCNYHKITHLQMYGGHKSIKIASKNWVTCNISRDTWGTKLLSHTYTSNPLIRYIRMIIIPGCGLSLSWSDTYLSISIFTCILKIHPSLASSSLGNPLDISKKEIWQREFFSVVAVDENENSKINKYIHTYSCWECLPSTPHLPSVKQLWWFSLFIGCTEQP